MLKVKTSTQVFSKNFQMSQLTVQRNQKICNLLNFEIKKKKKKLLKCLVCKESKDCMYRECTVCSDKCLPRMSNIDGEKDISFLSWVTKKLPTESNDGENKQRVVTVKEQKFCTLWDLFEKFENELTERFARHAFNIQHQYAELKKLRMSLTEDEAILHIDFSENYGCKYATEIQSVHFGASHRQISLHTGVIYLGSDKIIPFCSMSNVTRHDPVGIWAHLQPVLKRLLPSHKVTTLYFVSDGPTMQYRNRYNFYLTSLIPFNMGYKAVSWNFSKPDMGRGLQMGWERL